MRQTIFIVTFLFQFVKLYAQSNNERTKYQDTVFIKHTKDWTADTLTYTTDTVIFETGMRRHVLSGTTILPETEYQQEAKGYGLFLNRVTKSDCQKDVTAEGGGPPHINSISLSSNALIIDMNIYENCCYSFLCDISIVDDSILNLVYYGYGTYCSCDCCFGLTYQMKREEFPDFEKLKYIMINGNRKTLKNLK